MYLMIRILFVLTVFSNASIALIKILGMMMVLNGWKEQGQWASSSGDHEYFIHSLITSHVSDVCVILAKLVQKWV